MKTLTKALILSCCVGAAVLFAGCGGSGDKSASSAAPAKGEISLYTSQPEADAQKLIEAFNKKYPGREGEGVPLRYGRSGEQGDGGKEDGQGPGGRPPRG